MSNKKLKQIFKTGSRTFYNSALFFPKEIRQRVTVLYVFVRRADDFVDSFPQDREAFYNFKREFQNGLKGKQIKDEIVSAFLQLFYDCNFSAEWVEAFFRSMEMDLQRKEYDSLEDFLIYSYGSAEVIGFFMVRIMKLPEEAMPFSAMLGRAFQLINVLRDIAEDNALGRRYLWPGDYGLKNLSFAECKREEKIFAELLRERIVLFEEWLEQAEKGYRYIPFRPLLAIKTAADAFRWTAKKIFRQPLIIFHKKVKPSRLKIFSLLLKNFFVVCYHKLWTKY